LLHAARAALNQFRSWRYGSDLLIGG
jgi:hypothetical protein